MAGARRLLLLAIAVALPLLVPAAAGRAAAAVFDPGGWNVAQETPVFRPVKAVALADGTALAWGVGTRMWRYLPAPDHWVPARSAPAPLGYEAVVLPDGRLWALTDKSISMYDPETDTWSTLAPIPAGRNFFSVVATSDGRLVASSSNADGSDPSCSLMTLALTQVASIGPKCAAVGRLPDGRLAITVRRDTRTDLGFLDTRTVAFTLAPPIANGRVVEVAVLTTGEILLLADEYESYFDGKQHVGYDVFRARLLDPATLRSRVVATPEQRNFGTLLPLPNGAAIFTGGDFYRCSKADPLCGSDPSEEREAEPDRSTQVFDGASGKWHWAEPSTIGPVVGVALTSGRVAFVGKRAALFSPPGLSDTERPRSTTKTGALDDRDVFRVHGVSRDGFSGIAQVRVTFTPRLAPTARPVVRASMKLSCTAGRHRCDWAAKSPRLDPGTYSVSVSATDRAGNVEKSASHRTVVVA